MSATTSTSTRLAARPHPRRRRRGRDVLVALAVALPLAVVGALTVGSSDLSPLDAVGAVLGLGDEGAAFVVRVLRLPRVITAVAVGGALGLSGLLLQGLLRNPLGSPDVMGVTAGASFATVVAIGLAVSPLVLPLAAGLGAGVATAILYVATTRSGASGARLVLAGIGVHAAASAGTTLAVARLRVDRLGAAEVWLAGSLHARTWTHVTTIGLVLAVALPAAFLIVRRLGVLELGDDLAVGMGVPVRSTRTALLVISAVLAGAAVAVSGPIGFVALGAPHIARRLVGGGGGAVALATAGLVGALLVLAADLIAQRILHPTALPAGVVSAAIGAPYLLWLLHRWGRR